MKIDKYSSDVVVFLRSGYETGSSVLCATENPRKRFFWVVSLVLNSVGVELGLGSIEHLLNNVSLVHEDFAVDGQP